MTTRGSGPMPESPSLSTSMMRCALALQRTRRSCSALVLVALLSVGPTPSLADELPAIDSTADVDLTLGVDISMRDGTRLKASLYRPRGLRGRVPAIVTRTPYTVDRYHAAAMHFARGGYVFVAVDVRGRAGSEGEFLPFHNEDRDGYDSIEWAAAQPWCNGKVAMWGGSYLGFTQWAALKELPPHLVAIAPTAAVGIGVTSPFGGGVANLYEARWSAFVAGRVVNPNLFTDTEFWTERYREAFVRHVPLRNLGEFMGLPSEWLRLAARHPAHDVYWRKLMPTPAQFAKMSVPILTITGAYDGDQPGALHYYRSHLRYAPPEATVNHHLIIGPWDHPGTRTPKSQFGGLALDEASLLDVTNLHVQWYDWVLRGAVKPAFLQDRVAYYVTGAETWKHAPSLNSIASETRTLYLGSRGSATDVFRSGSLSDNVTAGAASDTYAYDPRDTRAAQHQVLPFTNFLTDQRYALNLCGAGLVYHSEAFAADTEISGVPRLDVWLSMDVPDTDIQASLYEIQDTGASILLSSVIRRARYRRTLEREELVTPGAIQRYVFDDFTFFARRIASGSRLRLVLGAPNNIYWERNYNTGGSVAEESAADARVAHVILHHDADHRSALTLPIVR